MSRSRFDSRLFRIFLLLVIPTMAAAQNNLFTTTLLSPVASLPLAITTGDFNGDGIVDAAVTSSETNQVSILLGTGGGTFKPAVNYPVGAYPVAIVAGDFNRDGHLDLAVLNNNPNKVDTGGSISILTGQGDGTFVAGATYAVGYLPTALAVGDFDGDGNLDLAAVISNPNLQFNPGFVTIFTGSATGTFTAQANYGVGLVPSSIAVGDFNGDGKLDLAVGSAAVSLTNPQSEVSILVNTGGGNFSAGSSFVVGPLGSVPISIAAADFNNDGRLDLALALNNTNGIVICQGNGDGTFAVVTSIIVGNEPTWLATADFNGDGKIDLIVDDNPDDTVSVLLGNGDETFAIGASYPTGLHSTNLALADLNGDGKLDVAIVNNGDSNVQVLAGQGDGTFRAGTYSVGANPGGIATGDFNGDGIPDLVVTKGDGTATIFLGDGHGGFQASSSFSACPTLSAAQVVTADVNGDGNADLAISCNDDDIPYQVRLFQGKGDGTFVLAVLALLGSPFGGITAADIDSDGIPEFIISTPDQVVAANLDGNVDSIYQGSHQGPVEAGDFNGDGNVDFLATTGGQPIILLGDGHGNFQVSNPTQSIDRALVGDFNGDGLDDFAFSYLNSDIKLQLALSNGDGTFFNGFSLPPTSVVGFNQAAADFNGDGILDILTCFGAIPLGVLYGRDDATFVDSGTALGIHTSLSPVIADFDGDGSPDVAILDEAIGAVSILLNKNSFQLTSTVLSESPAHVVAGQPLNLSAAVGSKQGTPSGSVVFKQDGVVQTSQSLNAGAAQTTLSAPSAVGQYGYTALYTGDGTFSGSLSQRLLVSVSAASSTTVVTSSQKNSKLGQSVTLTATVKPQYSGVPTGTVEFYSDGEPIGSAAMSSGQASVNISSLALGNHTIEADYSGDASFTTSVGLLTQKVGKASSTVALASSLNPAVYGQAVTLTATVTDSDGIAPTGIVVFSEGGTIYGSVTLNAGVAQLTLPQLLVGKHTITAQYSGDGSDNSSKATLSETIQGASSTTTITSSLNPSNYGQAVVFTATVTSTAGVADGTVTFKNGTQGLGTVTLSGGQAQLSVTTIDAGAHTVKAIYNGSTTFATSQNSLQQVVVAVPTTVVLTASPNPASSGQTVTLTATVNCATGVPTGTVTIKDGKTVLGTASVVNGQGQFTTSSLSTGTHSLSATFSGSQDFAKSTSASLQEVIN